MILLNILFEFDQFLKLSIADLSAGFGAIRRVFFEGVFPVIEGIIS